MSRRTNLRWFGWVLALIIAHAASHDARAQEKKAKPVLASDKGRFRVVLDGAAVGTEEFEIAFQGQAWVARDATDLRVPGSGEMKANGELQLTPDGAPLHYQWSAESPAVASGSVDFSDGTAKCTSNLNGPKPIIEEFHFGDTRIIVLDNNFYYQYAVLARLYDWGAGGEQNFHVLIPQDRTPGSLTVKSQNSGGGLAELLVKTPDIEIHLFCDSSHRLVRVEVPSSRVVIERE